ncbi:MAG: WD40 repeat domain-containing protein [Phycisphaeraceae bacterium]
MVAIGILLSSAIASCKTSPRSITPPLPSPDVQGASATDPIILQTEALYGLDFSRDGTKLLVIGKNVAQIYDTHTWRPLGDQMARKGMERGTFDAKADRVLTVDYATWIRLGPITREELETASACVWDAKTGKRVAVIRHAGQCVNDAAMSPDGSRVVTINAEDDRALVWDVARGELELVRILKHPGNVRTIQFDSTGEVLVTTYKNSDGHYIARLWNFATGETHDLPEPGEASWYWARPSLSNNGLIVLPTTYGISVYDISSLKLILRKSNLVGSHGQVFAVGLSPDGKFVGASHERESIWEVETGKLVSEGLFPAMDYELGDALPSFNADGVSIALPGNDGACIRNLRTGQLLRKLNYGWAHQATFSPDGTMLAYSYNNQTRVIFAKPDAQGSDRWKKSWEDRWEQD